MKTIFTYKFKQIQKVVSILSNKATIGRLSFSEFSSSAKAEIFDNTYNFKRRNYFSSTTDVHINKNQKSIATIRKNIWTKKAKINIANSAYLFKYKNILCREWNISDEYGHTIIDHKKINHKDKMIFEEENCDLFLAGLYLSGRDYIESSNISWAVLIVVLYCTIFIN